MQLSSLQEIDKEFTDISKKLESFVLRYVNPINTEQEKQKFLKNKDYTPRFSYLPKNLLYSYFNFNWDIKELLSRLSKLSSPESLYNQLIETERKELLAKTDLVRYIGSKQFTKSSISYYGHPSKQAISSAKKLLNQPIIKKSEEQKISPEQIKDNLAYFIYENKLPLKISLTDTIGSRAMISYEKEPKIYLNKNSFFSQADSEKLIVHEIETHFYRYLNGSNQKFRFLGIGFGKYTLTEEGLAVFNEHKTGILKQEQLLSYASRLYAIHLSLKFSFREVFEKLSKYLSEEQAFETTLRAKRGCQNMDEPGAFTKDYSYYQGFLEIKKKAKSKKFLRKIHYAKIGHEVLSLLEQNNLLEPQPYLPRYLQ